MLFSVNVNVNRVAQKGVFVAVLRAVDVDLRLRRLFLYVNKVALKRTCMGKLSRKKE